MVEPEPVITNSSEPVKQITVFFSPENRTSLTATEVAKTTVIINYEVTAGSRKSCKSTSCYGNKSDTYFAVFSIFPKANLVLLRRLRDKELIS